MQFINNVNNLIHVIKFRYAAYNCCNLNPNRYFYSNTTISVYKDHSAL